MATISHNQNGHRRRELVKRVKAEEHNCALCDQPVDKTLTMTPRGHGKKCPGPPCAGCQPHPMRAEVDEIVARKWGGSPYDRANTQLIHRSCNAFKSAMTMAEARMKWFSKESHPRASERTPVTASPIW